MPHQEDHVNDSHCHIQLRTWVAGVYMWNGDWTAGLMSPGRHVQIPVGRCTLVHLRVLLLLRRSLRLHGRTHVW